MRSIQLRRRLAVALAALMALTILAGNVFAGAQPSTLSSAAAQDAGPRPIISSADANVGVNPLKDTFPLYSKYAYLYEIPRKWLPNRTNPAQPEAPDPNLQDAPLAPNVINPDVSFDGVNNRNGVLPPDPTGDIGPNHYVQAVNLSFAIYSRTGALLYGPANVNTLFTGMGGPCETTNDGDPIVQYDHLADRWLISQFALPNYPRGPFYECIAISQTPDPTGAWYRYQFAVSNTKMDDYPKIGVWPDGYYMSVNQFNQGRLTWGGQGVVVFEREKMLLGQTARMVYFDLYGTDTNLGGMLPSDLDGPVPPAGAPNYFLQVDDDAWGYSPDQLQVWRFHADWTNPASSTFTKEGNIAVNAFDSNMCGGSRNCIPQPGGVNLDAIADRLMYRLQYRNFGSHQTLVVNHTVDATGADRAGVRWYELRRTTGNWGMHQQATYSPDANHRWMASIAMNGQGDIALGYTLSSTSVSPSVKFTGRVASDAAGQMTLGENTLVAGSGYQTHSSGRWGDYSQMSIDPTDDCSFWYTQEYYNSVSSAGWVTRIGSFKFPACGGTPLPTPTPTDTPIPGPTNTPTNTPLPGPTNTPTNTPAPTATGTATNTPAPTLTSTPTNTPAPAAGMHIGDLDGVGASLGALRWRLDVTITAHDANHAPLAGAQVNGSWSSGGSATCTTGASGTCVVTVNNLGKNRNPSVTFTVNTMTKAGYTYQASANHDPESDSNGTSITITSP